MRTATKMDEVMVDRDIAAVRGKTQEMAVLDDAWDKGKQD